MPLFRNTLGLFLILACTSAVTHAHPGNHGTQRVAPDNQSVPLEIGTIPEIPDGELVILKVGLLDFDTAEPLPHRVRITDKLGRYYPPVGHTELGELEGHVDNVFLEPDVVNRGNKTWAMIENGTFTVRLRALDGYSIRFFHGLEYDQPVLALNRNWVHSPLLAAG